MVSSLDQVGLGRCSFVVSACAPLSEGHEGVGINRDPNVLLTFITYIYILYK